MNSVWWLLLTSSIALAACAGDDVRYEYQARYTGEQPGSLAPYVSHVASDGERVFIGYPSTQSPLSSVLTPARLSVLRLDDDGEGLLATTSVDLPFEPANVAIGEQWIAVVGRANEVALLPVDSDPLTLSAVLGPYTTSTVSDAAFRGNSLFVRSVRSVLVVDVDAAVQTPSDAESWRSVLDVDDIVRAMALTPSNICTIGWSSGQRRTFKCWDAQTSTQRLTIWRNFVGEFAFANTLVAAEGLLYAGSPDAAVALDVEGRRFVGDPSPALRGDLYSDHLGEVWSVRKTENRTELRRVDVVEGRSHRVVADLCDEARDIEVIADHLLVACGTEGLQVYVAR